MVMIPPSHEFCKSEKCHVERGKTECAQYDGHLFFLWKWLTRWIWLMAGLWSSSFEGFYCGDQSGFLYFFVFCCHGCSVSALTLRWPSSTSFLVQRNHCLLKCEITSSITPNICAQRPGVALDIRCDVNCEDRRDIGVVKWPKPLLFICKR